MKASAVIASLVTSVFCFNASATNLDKIAVYATEKSVGSMSIGKESAYSKTFEIAISNLSNKNIDLSKLCLKAFSPDGKTFMLDTIDEKLVKGVLKATKITKGFATFTSKDDAVYKAALIKIAESCK